MRVSRPRRLRHWALVVAGLLAASPAVADPRYDALLRAYPEQLAAVDGNTLIWRDGTRMPLDDGNHTRSLSQAIREGSIWDQLRLPYPAGPGTPPPAPDDDPGRIRNRAFFDKMYGDCRRGETAGSLVPVVWLPHSWNRTVMITSVNGVNHRLEAISRALDALPPELTRYLYPPGGTYNCRLVPDTGQPSLHGRGVAIDINVALSDFWAWRHGAGPVHHTPDEIVTIFEQNGFIWGGKWSHYDTMHFEYRPELLNYVPPPRD